MRDQKGNSMNFIIIAIVIIAVAGIGYYLYNQSGVPAMPENGDENGEMMGDAVISLSEQSDSGQSGTARIEDVDGRAQVTITISGGASGVGQPAHIHNGLCADIGGVQYPLNDVMNGASATLLPLSVDELYEQLPLALNVHKSADEIDVYVACGNLDGSSADAMMDDHMMEDSVLEGDTVTKDESMMDGDEAMTSPDEDSASGGDDGAMSDVKSFDVSGRNFAFDVKEIRVQQGDTVRINFTSESGFHDWVVDEFDARTGQLNTGESDSIEFVADQVGTFEYYCSVMQHRALGMVGTLIVE